MRWLIFLMTALLVTPVMAENLLTNPEFDLDPTIPGNGWSTVGTGLFLWNQSSGDPTAPSARTDQIDDESMILFQCVEITGGLTFDFSARSYTHSSIGASNNGVALSVYESSDCSGDPIETVYTDQTTFPNWALRERQGYTAPANALSARIELFSEANGDNNYISWDNVKLTTPSVPVETKNWSNIKALFR